jgi:hypothetical protein
VGAVVTVPIVVWVVPTLSRLAGGHRSGLPLVMHALSEWLTLAVVVAAMGFGLLLGVRLALGRLAASLAGRRAW